MDSASAQLPSLTPRESHLLAAFFTLHFNPFHLAQQENLSPQDLLNFTQSASIQANLAALRQFAENAFSLRAHQAHLTALDHLEEVAKTTPNPVEKRRAATTILRSLCFPGSPQVGRASSPPSDHPTRPTPRNLSEDDGPVPDLTSARGERVFNPLPIPSSKLQIPDPFPSGLSGAYRAAAAILSKSAPDHDPEPQPEIPPNCPSKPPANTRLNHSTPQTQPDSLNISGRISTSSALPPQIPAISGILEGCSSYLPSQLLAPALSRNPITNPLIALVSAAGQTRRSAAPNRPLEPRPP